jgi:hypothetical protein
MLAPFLPRLCALTLGRRHTLQAPGFAMGGMATLEIQSKNNPVANWRRAFEKVRLDRSCAK